MKTFIEKLKKESLPPFLNFIKLYTDATCFFYQGFCKETTFHSTKIEHCAGYKAIRGALRLLCSINDIVVLDIQNFHHGNFHVREFLYLFTRSFDINNNFVSFFASMYLVNKTTDSRVYSKFSQVVTLNFVI